MKLFTVAGMSTHKGKSSYRFANSLSRAQVLARNGHEHVELFVLPNPMTKESAIEYLKKGSLSKQIAANRVDKSKTKATPQVPALAGMTPLGLKPAKETVLWKSMSRKMRSIEGMETLQFAGD